MATELVTNGGFDSNTTGWAPQNSGSLASVSGGVSGNCCSLTEGGGDNPWFRTESAINVTAGKYYKFSVWIKAGTANKYRVGVLDNQHVANIADSNWTDCAGAGWEEYSETFQVPVDCTSVYIRLFSYASSGDGKVIYFDSISLKETESGNAIMFGANF